jgi:hypothetical protein
MTTTRTTRTRTYVATLTDTTPDSMPIIDDVQTFSMRDAVDIIRDTVTRNGVNGDTLIVTGSDDDADSVWGVVADDAHTMVGYWSVTSY